VNHVPPAWDVAVGLYRGLGLLSAERVRTCTGKGQEVTPALADAMAGMVANPGCVTEAQVNGAVHPPIFRVQ
jgi:2-methylfumaryl-CoA isomerase